MNDSQQIVITLEPMPDTVPVANRLRALLKTALRRDRLRCVKVDWPEPERPEPMKEPA